LVQRQKFSTLSGAFSPHLFYFQLLHDHATFPTGTLGRIVSGQEKMGEQLVGEANHDNSGLSLTTREEKDSDTKQNSQANQKTGRTHYIAVALIEAASKLFWPVIVAFALFAFERPIYNAINAAAGGSGANIEIAGVKISLPKNAIPPPPYRIRGILPQLDSEALDFIAQNVGGDNTTEFCWPTADVASTFFAEDSVYSRLKKLDMITFDRADIIDSDTKRKCPAGARLKFKQLYDLTRGYLVDILKAVNFSSAPRADTGATR